jgi:hypothetical protein
MKCTVHNKNLKARLSFSRLLCTVCNLQRIGPLQKKNQEKLYGCACCQDGRILICQMKSIRPDLNPLHCLYPSVRSRIRLVDRRQCKKIFVLKVTWKELCGNCLSV